MNKKRVIISLYLAVILTTVSLKVQGQEKKGELKDKKITIQMDKKPLFDVFMQLIYDQDVAIGFEESTLDKDHNDYHFETNIPYDERSASLSNKDPKLLSGLRPVVENHLISVNYKDARLEDVMDDIVKQMKNYDWEINNEVINIFPIKGRDKRFENLMNLKIRKFNIWKGAEVGLIQPLIVLNLSEFRTFLGENKLDAVSEKIAPWYDERPLQNEMKFSDLTFKELLNSITKSKRGGWILRINKHSKNQEKELIEILI